MRKNLYLYKTSAGSFYIAEENGRFLAVYEDESLGGYDTPQWAAEDLAGGHTFSPSSGIDSGTLGIPADLSEWQRLF